MKKSDKHSETPLEEKEKLHVQLNEFARNYNVSLELLEKTSDDKELMEAILDEYLVRLNEFEGTDLKTLHVDKSITEKEEKFKSLVMFATQAAKLHEKAKLYKKLDEKNHELKSLNEQLDQKNNQLASLNEHYLNMLSFASHELRSPLISILGYAELLSDHILGEINAEQSDATDIIIKVSKNLLEMIKNYLDLTKIETGQLRLKINRQFSDVQTAVIEPVLFEMREQFSKKQMKAIPQKIEKVTINIDNDLIRTVFTNLFTNAVKYGRHGTEIFYSISRDSDNCLFTIKNYGVGVKSEKVKSIFNKFTQAAESQQIDSPKGTGLGLFIAKTIVEEHGGTIWAESEYGEWFKTSFTIPLTTEQSSSGKRKSPIQNHENELSLTSEQNENGQSQNTHH